MRSHWIVGFGQPVPPQDESRGSYSRAEAFIDLIMECRLRDGYVNNGGVKMLLNVGQLLGAVSWLAHRWNWTPKTVRVYLAKLKNEGMITLTSYNIPDLKLSMCTDGVSGHSNRGNQKGKQAQVISVCKFSDYQTTTRSEGEQKGEQRANEGQMRGERGATYKEEQRNNGTMEQEKEPAVPASSTPLILIHDPSPTLPFAEPLSRPAPEPLVLTMPQEPQRAAHSDVFIPVGPPAPTDNETRSTASPEPPRPGRQLALEAFALWNDLALRVGLPQAAKLTPSRERALVARLNTYGLEGWIKALLKVERSKFLRGQTQSRDGRSFRADLDFLCQASSFDRVIDGRYDDAKPQGPVKGPISDEERDRIRREMRAVAGGVA
jgi:hypothetical protein